MTKDDKKVDVNDIDALIKKQLKETYGDGFSNIGGMMEDVLKNAMNNMEQEIDIDAIQEQVPGVDTKTILEQAKKAKEEAIAKGTNVIQEQSEAMAKVLNEQFFGANSNVADMIANQMNVFNQMMGGTHVEGMPEVPNFNKAMFGEVSLEKVYELIKDMYEEIPEGTTKVVNNDDKYIRQFEILLSGVLTYLNGHESNQLAVEDDDEFFKEKIDYILSEIWGITNKEETLDTIGWLLNEGHTDEYMTYRNANKYEECIDVESTPEDIEIVKNGFEFAQFFKDKLPENIILGWDYGRASMICRWAYFMGYLSEEETWSILDHIASVMIGTYKSWKEYGISYIVGGLFWTYRTDPNGVYDRYQETIGALEGLLGEEDEDDGDWLHNPWISDVN